MPLSSRQGARSRQVQGGPGSTERARKGRRPATDMKESHISVQERQRAWRNRPWQFDQGQHLPSVR